MTKSNVSSRNDASLIVTITPDYRLTADDRQYVLQRRHTIDPSRNPFKKADVSAVIRDDWRDVGYYSLNVKGLSSAIEAVILRGVNDSTEAQLSIAELLAAYQAETARLSTAISAAMSTLAPTN